MTKVEGEKSFKKMEGKKPFNKIQGKKPMKKPKTKEELQQLKEKKAHINKKRFDKKSIIEDWRSNREFHMKNKYKKIQGYILFII